MFIATRLFQLRKRGHQGGFLATSGVIADHLVLRGLIDDLLECDDGLFGVGSLSFLQKVLGFTQKRARMRLQAQVTRGAAIVLAQVFNGGVLIWHKMWGEGTGKKEGRQQLRYLFFD